MITGSVDPSLVATIRLRVNGAHSQFAEFDAILDTGFNGDLTLPSKVIEALDLVREGSREAILADGSVTVADLFNATVIWERRQRNIRVVAADSSPLVGMELLRGYLLTIQVKAAGRVSIELLEDQTT